MTIYHLSTLARLLRLMLLLMALLMAAIPTLVGFLPGNTPGLAEALSTAPAETSFPNGQDGEMIVKDRMAPLDLRLGLAAAVALGMLPSAMVLVCAAQALGPTTRGSLFDRKAARLFRSAAIWSLVSLVTAALGAVALDNLLSYIVTGDHGHIAIRLGISIDGMARGVAALALYWIAGVMDHGTHLQHRATQTAGG